MEIIVGCLVIGLGFALVRLVWLDRTVQRLSALVLGQEKSLDKMADLMIQSGEILLTIVKKDN